MVATAYASTIDPTRWGGPSRYIRIVVHDSLEHFQRAAEAYRDEDMSGAAGCFHPAALDSKHPHYAGLLRLTRGWITPKIVAHETVHAALAIYRMDVVAGVNLGHGCGHREETLAHITGQLIPMVSQAVFTLNAWN